MRLTSNIVRVAIYLSGTLCVAGAQAQLGRVVFLECSLLNGGGLGTVNAASVSAGLQAPAQGSSCVTALSAQLQAGLVLRETVFMPITLRSSPTTLTTGNGVRFVLTP